MNNKKYPFISLRVKAVFLAFITGAIIIALSNLYFSGRAEKLLYKYTMERMVALGEAFASNAGQGELLQNRTIAEQLCYGANQEPDVLFALILDRGKNIVAGNYGGIPDKYFRHIRGVIDSNDLPTAKEAEIAKKGPFDESKILIQPIYSSRMKPTAGSGLVDDQEKSKKEILGYSVIIFSLKGIKQEIQKTRLAIAGISIIALLIIVACFYGLVTILIRNLERLLRATSRLEKGDLSARVDIHSHDEIEKLGNGFNKMAGEVEVKTTELQQALEKIRQASLETIYRLSLAAEYRDWDTGQHLLRMSHYTKALAAKMGLKSKYTEAILYASLMHDVGKIGIPDHILRKPGRLTPEEWEIMKKHTVIGAQILEKSETEFIKMAESIALTHHERWDGAGYPKGLKGEEISLAGRIVAVADVFEAVTSKRPYKEAFPVEKAFEIIKEGRGTHFDPRVVDAFFEIKDEILKIKNRNYYDKDHRI